MATFRSRLLWLATARVVVVTLLLGSAILVQFAAPGALPVTPFFLLIALTYALTAGYGLLLKRAEQRPWIADAALRQASNRIADLQAFSQHVIDSLASGLATTDPDGTIVTFNRAAEAITGVDARRAVGRPIAEVLQWPAKLREQFASEEGRR